MSFLQLRAIGLLGYRAGQVSDTPVWIYLYFAGIFLCAVVSYLLGSINPAILISKIRFGEDIREKGSGNPGTTNMLRNYGKKFGAMTFGFDLLKTAVSVIVGTVVAGFAGAYVAGFCCMLGHMFPCYYGFKGGKGVAVVAAMVLLTEPLVFLVLLAIFAVALLITKYVSLGSIFAAAMYPIVLYNFLSPPDLRVVVAFAAAVLIIAKHKENIIRLREKSENKTYLSKLFIKKSDKDKNKDKSIEKDKEKK